MSLQRTLKMLRHCRLLVSSCVFAIGIACAGVLFAAEGTETGQYKLSDFVRKTPDGWGTQCPGTLLGGAGYLGYDVIQVAAVADGGRWDQMRMADNPACRFVPGVLVQRILRRECFAVNCGVHSCYRILQRLAMQHLGEDDARPQTAQNPISKVLDRPRPRRHARSRRALTNGALPTRESESLAGFAMGVVARGSSSVRSRGERFRPESQPGHGRMGTQCRTSFDGVRIYGGT